ncbi:prolyl oligopeptidase family serine peptidase [uncultured Rubinisphaera sp.]|uniref:prolyl oligopeptidase family serine peptidase n=1 Tax=uncultured Rubinisphaera sp. TaxID=1678686 RepID=UPI0030DA86BB
MNNWSFLRMVSICLLVALCYQKKTPADEVIKKLILPGESFLVENQPAFILWPAAEKRTTPQPWVLYAPTLPAYPDQHEKWMHEQFLKAGVAVAGIDVGEAYGSPRVQRAFTALYDELVEKRGFASKPCLLGRSRGGLWVSSWAVQNTDKVAGLAGIYPVFDLRTYPGLNRAAPAFEMTAADLEKQLDQFNPIAKTSALAKAGIPVCIIHGNEDTVVPLHENSETLLNQYQQADNAGLYQLIVPQGQGHNFWTGFFHCQNLVEFTIERAKAGAGQKVKVPKQQQIPANTVMYKDIEFRKVGENSLLLDLYRPPQSTGVVPVIIWVHGGGWKNGSKDRCPATWLVEEGYAVASINYRLTDQAQWPAQIEDCRAAVRWVRENAAGFQLDGDHIAAWGSSAGGHLVALMGTLDLPENEKTSSKIQAACDWFGPTDLLTMPPNLPENGRTLEDVANSNGAKLLGKTVIEHPELAKQASAFYQVSAHDPPFLIMHGEIDSSVPLNQSQKLHDKLQDAGVSSTLIIIANAGHGGKEFQTPEVRESIQSFFDKHLHSN